MIVEIGMLIARIARSTIPVTRKTTIRRAERIRD